MSRHRSHTSVFPRHWVSRCWGLCWETTPGVPRVSQHNISPQWVRPVVGRFLPRQATSFRSARLCGQREGVASGQQGETVITQRPSWIRKTTVTHPHAGVATLSHTCARQSPSSLVRHTPTHAFPPPRNLQVQGQSSTGALLRERGTIASSTSAVSDP